MSSARERVFAGIRGALAVTGDDALRREIVTKRLKTHRRNLVPERGQTEGQKRLDLFSKMLEGQNARVSRAKTRREIPQIVASYLREHNLPAEFRAGTDPFLNNIPWDNTPSLTRKAGRGQGDDAVTLSHAHAAAAETGTLFLTSGDENPTTLNFLPDSHIVVIKADDILGSYEDCWDTVRATFGERSMPRTVNLVSGPSRTADIEQIIVMGAHGPRNLHVIVLG